MTNQINHENLELHNVWLSDTLIYIMVCMHSDCRVGWFLSIKNGPPYTVFVEYATLL